jgi:hypothetical protein
MLATCQNTLERMIRDGNAFEEIEDYINATSFPEVQKAALWLLAWSHQDQRVQRRVAKEALSYADTAADEAQDVVPMRQDRGPGASDRIAPISRLFGGSCQ